MKCRLRGIASRVVLVGVLLSCLPRAEVCAQPSGGGASPGITAALTKLFGRHSAFTAHVESRVSDSFQHEVRFQPMEFMLLDNQIRVEIDMAEARLKNMPPGLGDLLRQMGMARVVSLIRPDQQTVYVMYPDQQALLKMPMSADDAAAATATAKVTRETLGKEVVDGHPCVKRKVVITGERGQTLEATTWDASDLKDFPIRIETSNKGSISALRFSKIRFARPEASQFEPPTKYAQFSDPAELQRAVEKKLQAEKPAAAAPDSSKPTASPNQ